VVRQKLGRKDPEMPLGNRELVVGALVSYSENIGESLS
jgi:hypothetical protein